MSTKRAKLPPKIKVGPHEYRLVHDPEFCDGAGAVGQCLVDSAILLIDLRVAETQQRETVLHELLHAVWAQTALVKEFDDAARDSVGERIIALIAPVLLEIVRDNPRLVAFLQEKNS